MMGDGALSLAQVLVLAGVCPAPPSVCARRRGAAGPGVRASPGVRAGVERVDVDDRVVQLWQLLQFNVVEVVVECGGSAGRGDPAFPAAYPPIAAARGGENVLCMRRGQKGRFAKGALWDCSSAGLR
jgi:hypothetical protein